MKYYKPETVAALIEELQTAYEDFEFLITCKEANQPCGKYLDVLLEDEFVHLADKCEDFNFLFDCYIKEKNNIKVIENE